MGLCTSSAKLHKTSEDCITKNTTHTDDHIEETIEVDTESGTLEIHAPVEDCLDEEQIQNVIDVLSLDVVQDLPCPDNIHNQLTVNAFLNRIENENETRGPIETPVTSLDTDELLLNETIESSAQQIRTELETKIIVVNKIEEALGEE